MDFEKFYLFMVSTHYDISVMQSTPVKFDLGYDQIIF